MVKNKRIILITGGVHGLGRQLAEHLSRKGHEIIMLDIEAFTRLPNACKNIIRDYYEVDLAHLHAVNDTIDIILRKYERIDVLINNAALRIFKGFLNFNQLEIEKYINVNFKAPVLFIKKVFPFMKKNGYGRIINIASKSAFWGYSSGSMYCSTKSALVKFTEAFGKELNVHKDNVTINAICPDTFRTIEGKNLKGHDYIVDTICKTVDDILNSRRNSELIPILLMKTKLLEIGRDFKKHFLWLLKY